MFLDRVTGRAQFMHTIIAINPKTFGPFSDICS